MTLIFCCFYFLGGGGVSVFHCSFLFLFFNVKYQIRLLTGGFGGLSCQ